MYNVHIKKSSGIQSLYIYNNFLTNFIFVLNQKHINEIDNNQLRFTVHVKIVVHRRHRGE